MLLPVLAAVAVLVLAGPCQAAAGTGPSTSAIPVSSGANASLPLPPPNALPQARIAALLENRWRLLSSRLSSLESAESVASQAAREAALRGVWSILEDLLKALLEALRLMLDPAPLGSYDLSFNDSFITGRLALHRVRAEHLRDTKFHVKLLNPFTLCSQVQVELPWLTLKTYYDADLYLGDGSGEPMRIFGAGLAQVDLHNAQLTTKVCLEIKKFSILVADMKISLEKAEVDLPGLFGGGAISEMISGIATDVLPGAIQEYEPEITQLAMKYINEFLRHILHRGSLKTAKG